MKTFKSSYHFPYVWIEMVKKEPHTCSKAFNRLAGSPQGLCLIVTVSFNSNLQSSLIRCGTRPNEWGAQ